ncbi:MAG: class I mannose-6-phosphate isomerase [Bacteroidales bacterium]|nr:class I mannose-6-phosphate isomerase [Bacteroidales bacterium]
MAEIYPLKFKPSLKEKVWGGNALVTRYNKKSTGSSRIGESWELSAVSGNLSIVNNGFLAGNNIEELIEVYMGDITGDTVFEKFGNEFPLLIKFIEAREDLSIQVHPDNALAKKRHNAYGKTEMWYILESEKGSKLYTGFREGVTKEIYQEAISEGKLPDILNVETVEAGDVFFTPAGRVHAIGAGTVLAEIQQTSDITYRIFDWNRKDSGKEKRELHTDLALDAIDFSAAGKNKIRKDPEFNNTENLVSCEFFDTNVLLFNTAVNKEYYSIDSFVVYICIDGEFTIRWDGKSEKVSKGETVLLPATIKEVTLEPVSEARLLEIYINFPDCY